MIAGAMNARSTLLLLGLVCLLGCPPLGAAPRWFAIHLGDHHIGHLMQQRRERAGEVETRSELYLVIQRQGERLEVNSSEVHRETVDGRPLAFSSRFSTGGTLAAIDAEVVDGEVLADIRQGEGRSERRFAWPQGALLADGQRRALRELLASKARLTEVLAFDPTSMNALPLRSERLPDAGVGEDALAGLVQVRQTLGPADSGVRSELWLYPDSADVAQMRMPALGLDLLLRACSRTCATAPPQAADILTSTLIAAPRALSQREREGTLVFDIEAGPAALAPLDGIPGQQLIRPTEGRARLQVNPRGAAAAPPGAADSQPSRWLQSDDLALRELAIRAVGNSRDPARRMQRLERAVRQHIRLKSLRIGYASAAEVVSLREGDCTEHALLLAAMARALDIPARVITGLAYAPGYAGREHVFVPHAWVMAWVEGRWQGYDAALPAFGAAHIGLGMGNGEPFDFYGGLELIGRLRVLAVEPGRGSDEDRG